MPAQRSCASRRWDPLAALALASGSPFELLISIAHDSKGTKKARAAHDGHLPPDCRAPPDRPDHLAILPPFARQLSFDVTVFPCPLHPFLPAQA